MNLPRLLQLTFVEHFVVWTFLLPRSPSSATLTSILTPDIPAVPTHHLTQEPDCTAQHRQGSQGDNHLIWLQIESFLLPVFSVQSNSGLSLLFESMALSSGSCFLADHYFWGISARLWFCVKICRCKISKSSQQVWTWIHIWFVRHSLKSKVIWSRQ